MDVAPKRPPPRFPLWSIARLLLHRVYSPWHWLGVRRHPITVGIASLCVFAGVAVGFAYIGGEGKVLLHLRLMNFQWLAVCVLAQIVAYLGYVLAVHETARIDGGPKLGLRRSAHVVAAGFGAFFAATAAGGFEVDYWALRRAGAGRREALCRVLGLGTLEYAILAPAALGAALALLAGAGHETYPALTLPWLAVIPGSAFAVWATSPKRHVRLEQTDGRGRLRTAFGHAVGGLTILRRLVMKPLPHGGLALAGTSLYWFGEMLCLWAALRAFQVDLQVPALILAYATGYVVTRRALPAGGVGVAEVTLTLALTWVGVPFAPALLGVLTYRLFNYWLALIPALAVRGRMRDLREGIEVADCELARERA